MPDAILISELYGPVIQGEGALVGQVSHFVRTSGCPYRCVWCDSPHAVDPVLIKEKSRSLMPSEIISEVQALPPAPWVTITGGDPVAWDLTEVVAGLKGKFKLTIETQGSLWSDWLEDIGLVTCSPKPPSSGMSDRLDIVILQKYAARLQDKLAFKCVVFDKDDLDFAERIHRCFPGQRFFITAGTPLASDPRIGVQMQVIDGYRSVVEAVLERPKLLDVTVTCQQHVLLYGRELGR